MNKFLTIIAILMLGISSAFSQGCPDVWIQTGPTTYKQYEGLYVPGLGCRHGDPTGTCGTTQDGGWSEVPCQEIEGFAMSSIAELNPDGSVSIAIKEQSNTIITFNMISDTEFCSDWDCSRLPCVRTCVNCQGYTIQTKPTAESPDPQVSCD